MILRCTARMLDVIGGRPELVEALPSDDDWYANATYIDGKKCVLLTHVGTLFSVISLNVYVGILRPVAGWVFTQIVRALDAEGLPRDALGSVDYKDIRLARTADRGVLGSMNDMVHLARHIIGAEGGLERCDVTKLNRFLNDTPNRSRGFATPLELVGRRVAEGTA